MNTELRFLALIAAFCLVFVAAIFASMPINVTPP
jgi:hypothetical protein